MQVTSPGEFQGNIMGQLNRRMAVIQVRARWRLPCGAATVGQLVGWLVGQWGFVVGCALKLHHHICWGVWGVGVGVGVGALKTVGWLLGLQLLGGLCLARFGR